MATATGDPTFLLEQPPQGPPPQQAVTQLTYPQMILEAINALNDKNGASKSAISRQIESVHPDLSPAHNNLLSHHLNTMASAGQIVFRNNNYSIPDPDAPPRRGRGRPPKPKDPNAPPPAPASSSTRGRGRPPKDPSAPPKAKTPPSGRPRGRPPKKAKTDADAEPSAPAPAREGERRGRGRPPKVKPPVTPVAG